MLTKFFPLLIAYSQLTLAMEFLVLSIFFKKIPLKKYSPKLLCLDKKNIRKVLMILNQEN